MEKLGTSAEKETPDKLKNVLTWHCHIDESFHSRDLILYARESESAKVDRLMCQCACLLVCLKGEFLREAYGV